jgi:2'-5' RNA ligase
LRTALAVVPGAPVGLESVYRDSYPRAVAKRLPFHITLLFPFVPRERVDDGVVARLRRLFAAHERFAFALTRLETFPEVVWLAPEPAEPFGALTRAIHAEFPDYPPYEGVFAEVIPHATMAEVAETELDAVTGKIAARVEKLLPVELRADEVTLLEEDEDGCWGEALRLPLGSEG